MYEIKEKFISKNRSWQTFSPIGIVAHETASFGGTDEGHYSYFNNNNLSASAHAFVDWDSITQTVPWYEVAWHAGYTANNRFIGIEWCRPKTHDISLFNEVWKRGVWLYAFVFKNVLGINLVNDNNFWSHKRVSETWKETDHTDPIAYLSEYGKTFEDLKKAVQKCIDTGIIDDIGGNIVETRSISRLQDDLNWLGHKGSNGKPLVVDGDFGANSQFALDDFRRVNGINATGGVTELDWQVIEEVRYGIKRKVVEPTPVPVPKIAKSYIDLIKEVSDTPEKWLKAIDSIRKTEADLGDFEQLTYVPELLEKIIKKYGI